MLKLLIKQIIPVSMLLGVWDLVITVWMRPVSRPENLNEVLNEVNKVKEVNEVKRYWPAGVDLKKVTPLVNDY